MSGNRKNYDLIVIGCGPGGEKAAVKAAYFGYKVAVIEKRNRVGGAGLITGTLPSKTLKETSLYLSGHSDRGLFGVDRALTRDASVQDFMFRKDYVTNSESDEMLENLRRHGVDIYWGTGRFLNDHEIRVEGEKEEVIRGDYITIATGSTPHHPDFIPFDGDRIHDSDSILNIRRFPKSLCVVGAGVIGCEYATIFATMGCKVYLVNHSSEVLGFLDREISQSLVHQMSRNGVEILFNTSVESVKAPVDTEQPLRIPLVSGEILNVDMFLFAAGRGGNTAHLGCDKIGLEMGKRGQVKVNEKYQTNIPHIYAIGDVIGFPALASTSMDQGRVAVSHMFQIGDIPEISSIFPYGIYTIPEVSCVGLTEEQAKEQCLDYCVGRASYASLPRGKILGAKDGFMKVIFTRNDLTIRGVHIVGNIASELVHYGVLLVENQRTVKQVVSTIFNFPTLHDLYKYACYDGLGNLSGHKIKGVEAQNA